MFFLRQPEILKNLILMTLVWVTTSFAYYLIGLQVKYFPGDFRINALVLQLSDMLAYSSAHCFLKCLKAKHIFSFCFVLAGAAGVLISIIGNRSQQSEEEIEVGWSFTMFVVLARVGISASFNLVYIVHARMFPTLFSVTSLGISNFACRIAIATAPMVAEVRTPIPMSIFASICFLTAVASFFINESQSIQAAKVQ